jgi:hypothetical protein
LWEQGDGQGWGEKGRAKGGRRRRGRVNDVIYRGKKKRVKSRG